MAHDDMTVAQALREYVDFPQKPAREIADKYGISKATLTVWANRADIKLRGRGRDKQNQPDARTLELLEYAKVHTGKRTGKQFGITKQRVSRIMKRWKNWSQRMPPFAVGDVIEWKNQRYTVVNPDIYTGTVTDKDGITIRSFRWTMDGSSAVKVNANGNGNHNGHRNGKTKAKAAKAKVKTRRKLLHA